MNSAALAETTMLVDCGCSQAAASDHGRHDRTRPLAGGSCTTFSTSAHPAVSAGGGIRRTAPQVRRRVQAYRPRLS